MKNLGLSLILIVTDFLSIKKSRKLKLTQREELDGMKKDIEEIKNLLRMILRKIDGLY